MKKKIDSIARRIKAYRFRQARVQKRINMLALFRMLAFIGMVVGVSFAIDGSYRYEGAGLALLSAGVFIYLMVGQDRCYRYKAKCAKLEALLTDDLARARYRLGEISAGGVMAFADDHPFAHDLDCSGKYSVLKAIDNVHHRRSREMLKSWLEVVDPIPEIVGRQEAVTDLTDRKRLRLRLSLACHLDSDVDLNSHRLQPWLQHEKPWTLGPIPFIFGRILSLLTTTAVVLHFLFQIEVLPWLPLLLVQLAVFYTFGYFQNTFANGFMKHAKAISATCAVIGVFENTKFKAARLRAIQETLLVDGKKAGPSLKKLLSIKEMLDFRANAFAHFFLNALFLWDQWQLLRLSRWRDRFGSSLPHWVDAIFELEALSAVANFRWLYPGRPFPELVPGDDILVQAKNLGHPTIADHSRVGNDYELVGNGRLHLVTGSNMSGKSTFLRTVGINLILARMGAPVCAESLRCSLPPLWTSIKIQDSLAEGVSYFYAEVQRIKKILDVIGGKPKPVLVLFDEILKGTNSLERLIATKAMVRYLLEHGACGLITTHDLELLAIQKKHPDVISNYHFQEKVKDEEMFFDYRLKPGEITSTNALRVMQFAKVPLSFET